ncbi:DivIVA domain-containing protein [Agromyces sp. Marseille-Q5079]|uniref:DivIVA domain-containing protein n=1 Tax=Agromyces sp. Marseille-Q5079 TaxID=3439059 RepID=UPI003D9CAAB3
MTPEPTDDGAVPDAPPTATPDGSLASAVARLPEAGNVRFGIKGFGGGYDRAEVDAFIHRLSEDVAQVRVALEGDRLELTNLRAENARLRTEAGTDVEQEIAAGAVGLLSQAQLIADRAVADAEQYARDLVVAARDQYREVLERAERSAGHVVAGLATGPAKPEGPTLPEIEYVRTYAKVAQIQLRSVLDALTEQVDRLGNLPQADPEAVADPSVATSEVDEPIEEPIEEPDWSRPVATRGSFVEPETFTMPGSFSESSVFAESESTAPPAFPESRTATRR